MINKKIFSLLLAVAIVSLTVLFSSCSNIPDKNDDHSHELIEVPEVKATCTEAGVEKYYTCSSCDKLFADAEGRVEIDAPKVIEAKGHEYKKTVYPANCTEAGYTKYTCFNCDHSYNGDEVAAKGHSFTSYVSNNDATCTADGTKTAKCDNCDAIDTKVDEGTKKGHTPAEAVKENIENATCAKDGSYDLVVYCSVENCKHEISRETITVKATGEHVYATEKEKLDATCTVDGYVIMACGCGETEKTTISATGHKYESKVTAPTCNDAGFTTYTCSVCGDSYTADEVDALGHSYSAWTLTNTPTYEIEGIISRSCATCSGTEEKNLGTASEENGYTLIIGGVLSRWQYTYGDFTFTVDLTNTDAVTNTYSATNGTPWYVGFDASGAMVKLDGYKTTNASWDGTNLSFGGSGMTYYTTVTAPKATTVTLIINCARNKAKPFFTAGTEHCIDNLTVNGSSENVICFTDAQLSVTGWHAYTDYAIATLFLKEGDNVISFKSATTVNFKGIGYVSTEALHIHTDVIDNAVDPTCLASGLTQGIHCSECNKVIVAQETIPECGHNWSNGYTVLTAPTYTSEGSMIKKCTVCGIENEEIVIMPSVSAENGYNKVLEGVISHWEYSYNGTYTIVKIEETKEFDNYFFSANDAYNKGLASHNSTYNSGGYFGDTSGDVFTTYITVPEATSVNFIIRGGTKNTRSYSGETIVSSLTINGKTDGVVLTTELTKFEGWTTWVEFHVATLYLEEGVNTISFSLSSNLNIAGISFDSCKEVSLVQDYVDLDFMSFNIRQDTDSGVKAWANRKDALIQIILNANPSVICFQEVKKHQYEDIAAGLTDYTVLYYGRGGTTTEGLAIAYKNADWNEISRQMFWLSETPDVESKGWGASYLRICVNVLLQHKATGQYLNVFTVHLDFSDIPKQKGMELIVSRAAAMNEAAGIEYPTLIAGDYNDGIGGVGYNATLDMCNDVRFCAPVSDFYTTGSQWGAASDTSTGTIIDHIFVSKKHFASNVFEVIRTRDETGFYPSDHWAVIGKVALLIPHVHTEVKDAAVAADCTNTGLTEGKHCSTCGEVLVAQNVVDALGHSEVIDSAVEADCDSTGKTEGKHCKTCGEILVPQTVIDALGHAYDNDTDESCNRCDFIRDVSCAHTNKVAISEAKDATCTEPGNTAGEKCADCGEVFVEQEIFQPTGHTAITDVAVAPTCINTGLTEGSHCSVCGEVLVAQTIVDALGHTNSAAVMENEVVPTFDAAGSFDIVIYCSVCNAEVSRNTTALPALNFTDYTTETTASGATVTTIFTYSAVNYSTSLVTDDYISVDGVLYSRYEMPKLCDGNVTASYDATNGYIYHAKSEKTLTQLSFNGENLTLTGKITVNTNQSVSVYGGNLYIGTESVTCYLTINSTVGNSLMLNESATRVIQVNKGSTLSIPESAGNAIRYEQKTGSYLNIYGTLITPHPVSFNRWHEIAVYDGGVAEFASFNNGQGNHINVVGGTMTVTGNLNQTKNAKVTVGAAGTLNILGNLQVADGNGTLTVNGILNVGGNITKAATFTVGATGRCYVTGTANIVPSVADGGYAIISGTEYGTKPSSTEE